MKKPSSNLLLSGLSTEIQAAVVKSMKHVPLPFKKVLYEADQAPHYAYFLTSGLASVVSTVQDGLSAEVGMIGREGLVGALHLLGPALDPAACFMQADGSGWQIPFHDLKALLAALPELQARVLEFSQAYSFILTKTACCNRLHGAAPRLARWLLMASDRLQTGELPFTHDLTALLVGANRPTVSLALGALQRAGMLQTARGQLTIPKPKALEGVACECLPAIRNRIDALYSIPLDS